MKIGVDIDDVLYPWYDTAHEVCVRAGITNGVTPTQWDVPADYGCTLEEWIATLQGGTLDGSLYSGPPYPGVLRSLERLVEAGHTIHLVTARGWLQHGHEIKRHTVAWLREWEVPYSSLTFSRDKTILAADVFVDDSPTNYDTLWQAGLACFLIDQPWNQDVPAFFDGSRVLSFNHFTELVMSGTIERSIEEVSPDGYLV